MVLFLITGCMGKIFQWGYQYSQKGPKTALEVLRFKEKRKIWGIIGMIAANAPLTMLCFLPYPAIKAAYAIYYPLFFLGLVYVEKYIDRWEVNLNTSFTRLSISKALQQVPGTLIQSFPTALGEIPFIINGENRVLVIEIVDDEKPKTFDNQSLLLWVGEQFNKEATYLSISSSKPNSIERIRELLEKAPTNFESKIDKAIVKPKPHAVQAIKRPRDNYAEVQKLLLRIEDWYSFEVITCDIMHFKHKQAWLSPKKHGSGADDGIDIFIETDSETVLGQCKAWNSIVGVKTARELLGAMAAKGAKKGKMFTLYGGTFEATSLTDQIEFYNANKLSEEFCELPEKVQLTLLEKWNEMDVITPTCPNCKIKMVMRSSKFGKFWGCQNFPRCWHKQKTARKRKLRLYD